MAFEPKNPDFENRVRTSFSKQAAMKTVGGSIASIMPGHVVLEMPFGDMLTQQHGFIHAGIITTMLDSAAGYAAFSLMPADAAVLTVEFKTSLLAPANGDHFRFEGFVTKPGRTITFAEAEAYSLTGDQAPRKVASMTATMMAVVGRESISG